MYFGRLESYIGSEVICPNETHILLVPYGQGWRKLCKACQSLLSVKEFDSLLPIQNAEASETMFELFQSPGDCYNHIRRYSTAVILASVSAREALKFQSPEMQALCYTQEQFTEILAPGAAAPVDEFPFQKFLTAFLSGWRAKADKVRQGQTRAEIAKYAITTSNQRSH